MKKAPLLILAALGLVIVPRAAAHAEATPSKIPAGSVATVTLRIEGEMSVPAVKIAVQLPSELSEVSFQPAPGWKRSVSGRVVTWSGGKIQEGDFGTFAFSAHMPAAAGTEIVFPTVQTYANGKVIHWIGAESSDTPAPRVRLTAGKTRRPPPPPVTTIATIADDGGGRATWVVAATLVVAALAAVGLVFWWRRRR